jgi:tetratricopeptide (TPR) repeat protein
MGKKNKKASTGNSIEKDPKKQEPVFNADAENKLRIRLGRFIGLFAFVLYAQTISFNYTYDDFTVIKENKIVKQGIQGIPDILKSDYWYGFIEGPEKEKGGLIYRPASLIMFAVEWELFPDTPQVSHFINVLLYTLTCWFLFILLCRLFKNYSLIVPLLCTALFVIHPVHTEVVSNIKSRDEILCLLFAVCANIYFLKYYLDQKRTALFWGAMFFFLSLLSKETGVTFLVCIPLLLFVAGGLNIKRLGASAAMMVLVTVVYFFIRAQIDIGVSTAGKISSFDNVMADASTLGERLATAIYILGKYLYLLIIPHPLVSDYSYSQLALKTFSDPAVIVTLLAYMAAGIYALLNIRRQSLASFGILFFLVTLFPVSNILFLIGSGMAERFLYTPSLGFCILFTMLLLRIARGTYLKTSITSTGQVFSKYPKLFFIASILFAAYTIKTLFRSSDWKDNLSLFSVDAKNSPKSSRMHYGYGSAVIMSIDSSNLTMPEIEEKVDLGKAELETAISIYPEYANAYFTIGAIYKDRRNYAAAVANMENAIRYYPVPNPVFYKSIGFVYLKNGQYDKCINALDSFARLDTVTWDILNNKGSALYSQLKYADALQTFLKADSLNANDSSISKNIGRCYAYLQQYDKAEQYFKRTIQLEPGNSENYRFLGYTYQLMKDSAKANEQFIKANQIDASRIKK